MAVKKQAGASNCEAHCYCCGAQERGGPPLCTFGPLRNLTKELLCQLEDVLSDRWVAAMQGFGDLLGLLGELRN